MDSLNVGIYIQPVFIDGHYRVSIVAITTSNQEPAPNVQVMIGPGKFETMDKAYEYIKVAAPIMIDLVKGGLDISA
jgi:hypothetical protein